MCPFMGALGALCFEKFAFFSRFAESGLREVDVVDVGTRRGRSRCVLRGGDRNEQKQSERQRASAFHIFLQHLQIWSSDRGWIQRQQYLDTKAACAAECLM